jgi:hypothetical protein
MTDTAPTTVETGDSGPLLPSGGHPLDMSVAGDQVARHTDSPVPHDTAGNAYTTGRKGFATPNREALGVFQRASEFFSAKTIKVDASNGGTAELAGRQPGRRSIKVWVPSLLPDGSIPLGVIIAATEGECQQGLNSGVVLNVGDAITIDTEAPVFAGLIGVNTTGACQVVVEFDPPTVVSVNY